MADSTDSSASPEPDDASEAQHFSSCKQLPKKVRKFWSRRKTIFSKYNEGVMMTPDLWFGVTPEPIARFISERIASAPESKDTIIDAFGGAGGNVIQFALSARWENIYYIDIDPAAKECAECNARIYGVYDQITFILGDCFEVIKTQLADVVQDSVIFASPPWGGVDYIHQPIFDLSSMKPFNLDQLAGGFTSLTENVVLYLPRTSDLGQIEKWAPQDRKLDVEHYCIAGRSYALCVYFGRWPYDFYGD